MATIVLLGWPIVALIIAAQLPRAQSLAALILVPYLLLPEAYSIALPGLPDLDKTSMISYSMLLAFLVIPTKPEDRLPSFQDGTGHPWLGRILIGLAALLLLNTLMTYATNQDWLVYELRRLQALGIRDIISMISEIFTLVLPFYFAQRYLVTQEQHRMFMQAVVVAALLYTILMLIEVRLSPQLHNWVYGYHQHSFAQHIRDGYRPKVFLKHGIHVGFFICTAVLFAACLWRDGQGSKWGVAALWLAFILIISRNLGALAIAIGVLGVLFLFSTTAKKWFIIFACGLLLLYPAIRLSPISPAEAVLSLAGRVSSERAASFEFRMEHEESLLLKAQQRPLFGWGGWGRNRVVDELGRDTTVADGLWIKNFGVSGWVGYIGFFGLLTAPLLFFAFFNRARNVSLVTMGFALIMAGNLIYLIPNSVLSPVGWAILGALAGWLRVGAIGKDDNKEPIKGPKHSKYSRFRPHDDAQQPV